MKSFVIATAAVLALAHLASAGTFLDTYAVCTGSLRTGEPEETIKLLADIETIACAKKAVDTPAILFFPDKGGGMDEALVGKLTKDLLMFVSTVGGQKFYLKLSDSSVPAKVSATLNLGNGDRTLECSTIEHLMQCDR